MPDFDFDAFNHDQVAENGEGQQENHEHTDVVSLDPVAQVAEAEPVKIEKSGGSKPNLESSLRTIWKKWTNGKTQCSEKIKHSQDVFLF